MCGIQLAVKLVVYIHEAYKSYNDVFLRVERALLREAASKQKPSLVGSLWGHRIQSIGGYTDRAAFSSMKRRRCTAIASVRRTLMRPARAYSTMTSIVQSADGLLDAVAPPARGMTSHRLASFAACSSTLQQPHSPTALSPAKMLNVLNREPGVVVNSQIAHRVPGRYTLPPHAGGLLDRRPAHCGPVASRRRR